MAENKRKSERFDLPLIVKFRPAYGETPYALGLTKNLSSDGLALESRNFNFLLNENLELELKLPQNAESVPFIGDVMWKRQKNSSSFAGIKFKVVNEERHWDVLQKISSYTSIPFKNLSSFHNEIKDLAAVDTKTELPADDEVQMTSTEEDMLKGYNLESLVPDNETAKESEPDKQSYPTNLHPGLVKNYINDNSECEVTFFLPEEASAGAESVTIAGDFNNWSVNSMPMSRLEAGGFSAKLTLASGHEYRFRYFIDGSRWENDWKADKYVSNDYGCDDSVVIV